MKKLFFFFGFFFLTAIYANQLTAQTTQCTPAQIAACKKLSPTAAANCKIKNPACQKVCNSSQATKVAAKSELQNPFVKMVNQTLDEKKPACKPTCKSAATTKLTKNNSTSCQKKQEKLVEKTENPSSPIAQKVNLVTTEINN